MSPVLVDSNVILDVVTQNATWFEWSAGALGRTSEVEILVINAVVYAEVAAGFAAIEDVEEVLPPDEFRREHLPYEAAFLAGQAFRRYRQSGGNRRSPLPDFYIGAHAAVAGYALITRDAARYRSYFPQLALIAP